MRVSTYLLGFYFAVGVVFSAQAGMNPSRSSARLAFGRRTGSSTRSSFYGSRSRPGGAAAARRRAIPTFSLPVALSRNLQSNDHCEDDDRGHRRLFSSGSESKGGGICGASPSAGRTARGTSRSFSLNSAGKGVGSTASGRRSLSPGALPAASGGGRERGGRARFTPLLATLSSSSSTPSALFSAPGSASGLLAFSASACSSSTHSSSLASSFSSAADGGGATQTNAPSNNNGERGAEWPAPHPAQAYVARARCGQPYEHDVEAGGATRIKVVVSDLDGTLLGPNKLVSATTLGAVREARAKGIVFVPASGRSKTGMINSMGELGEDLKRDGAPLVCMNGLTVYGQADDGGDHGDIIHSELMCPKLAAQVVAFWKTHPLAQAAGVSLCGSEGETIVVESLDARTRSFTDYREPLPLEVGNWEDAIAGGMELNRLYFWGETRAAVDAFQDDLKLHLKDNPAELTRGVPEMIEVLPHGASKAVGLEALLNHLGVSPHEVIALGDMDNDVEMLQAVGHGVAMGQASLEVRQAAQFTAPTNALDGVAVALETFCGVRLPA